MLHKITIKNRFTGEAIYTTEIEAAEGTSEARLLGLAAIDAVKNKKSLTDADLTRANLTGADLFCANLTGAYLTGANLFCANLTRANLTGADLFCAYLTGANLTRANLTGAYLTRANLTGAYLTRANLTRIKSDVCAILATAPDEVPAVISALKEGRVNGAVYEGKCACLVGTIANARGVKYKTLEHDSARPAERWFLSIKRGDTPENSQVVAITLQWCEEWLANYNNQPKGL